MGVEIFILSLLGLAWMGCLLGLMIRATDKRKD